MKDELQKARKALDCLLRSLPDELTQLYLSVDCKALLTQLAETGAPSPAWLVAKAKALRLKTHLQHSAIEALASRLENALETYKIAGGNDPIRLAHAEADCAMLAAKQASLVQRLQDADQLVQAAILAKQQEDAAALLCSPLLQKLRMSLERTD